MWKAVIELMAILFGWISRGRRMEKSLQSIELRLLRLEVLEAMRRKNTEVVCMLMKAYKEHNGNYYLDQLYAEYMAKQKKGKKNA